ncbi:MAG: hypothetical protein QGG80_07440, partial [Candidatus Krumholzibacteria bacterium]|nr:hypothetical protein [Candidatus Krumholzibacteria bacterium]
MRNVGFAIISLLFLAVSYSNAQDCLDYSEFAHIEGSVDTPGYAYVVAISGNYAYVADHSSGLQIVDVSDPATPLITGSVDTPGIAQGVAISGNYAYVADDFSGLQIVDVSNPATPLI